MRSEGINKKWGTIYLGGNKEATLESIDAMQAAARQEQWNQRTQNDYLERVRERATDRAREILGAAHTERQNILTEARSDAERIRLETQVQYDKADKALADAEAIRAEAQSLREEAEAIRNAAQQEGFDAGLANARDELDAFRGAMGGSIAVVLQAIERQNAAIFAAWREEVVALVQTCVNKGTEWVLQDQHEAVLRALVMESVRQLDNRHTVTLRVHPDDEAAVADMFAAAREAMPDVERWIVQGDASVALGGLIAESPSSTVDNRLALRNELVQNILQHLTLPEGEAEVIAAQLIHEVVDEQVAHIASIAPPVPEPDLPPAVETAHEGVVEAEHASPVLETEGALLPADTASEPPAMTDAIETGPDPLDAAALAAMAALHDTGDMPNTEALPADVRDFPVQDFSPVEGPHAAIDPANLSDFASVDADTPLPASAAPADISAATTATPEVESAPITPPPAHLNPSLAELEEELLPLPAENSPAVDAVLAGGGFLSDDDNLGQRP